MSDQRYLVTAHYHLNKKETLRERVKAAGYKLGPNMTQDDDTKKMMIVIVPSMDDVLTIKGWIECVQMVAWREWNEDSDIRQ